MAKLTKRQEYLATLEEKKYTVREAVEFLKSGPKSNFEESVDVAINLGIDASKSDQTVRSATSLPAGTGKTAKVAVFAETEQAQEAIEAGADAVGLEDLSYNKIIVDAEKVGGKKVFKAKVYSSIIGYRAKLELIMKDDGMIVAKIPGSPVDIPVVTLMRALGLESDKDIADAISLSDSNPRARIKVIIGMSTGEPGILATIRPSSFSISSSFAR